MAEADFESFIQSQKERLAKERRDVYEPPGHTADHHYPPPQPNGVHRPIGNQYPATNGVEGTGSQDRRQWKDTNGGGPVTMATEPKEEGLPLGTYENKQRQLKLERQIEYQKLMQKNAASAISTSTPRKGPDAATHQPPTQGGTPRRGWEEGGSLPLSDNVDRQRKLREEKQQGYRELLATQQHQRGPGGRPPAGPQTVNGSSIANQKRDDSGEGGGLFGKLGSYEKKRKSLDTERKNEYNHLLAKLASRGGHPGPRGGPRVGGPESGNPSILSLPGLRDHPSADQAKMKARNAEYNDFLKVQGGRSTGMDYRERGKENGGRAGWGTPTYDEMLEQKRKQEMLYRRHGDTDAQYSPPGKLGGGNYNRFSGSEGYLNDAHQLQRLDRDYERKKVKFAGGNAADANALNDFDDWEQVRYGRSGDPYASYQASRPQEYQREAPGLQQQQQQSYREPGPGLRERSRSIPTGREDGGGILRIGHDPTPSAVKRQKDAYRRELESQIVETAATKQRTRASEGHPTPRGGANAPVAREPYREPQIIPRNHGPLLDDQRPLATILNSEPSPLDQLATVQRGEFEPTTHRPTNILNRGFDGLYAPTSVLSRTDNQPGYQPSTFGALPSTVPALTAYDQAYHYYGGRDPLNPPPASQSQQPYGEYGPPLTEPVPVHQPPPAETRRGQQQQQQRGGPVGGGFAVGQSQSGGGGAKESKLDYQVQLQRQIEEAKYKKMKAKEEQDRYDKKLEREIADYNPFGRGGGGAPMKDAQGNVLADLRKFNAGGGNPQQSADQSQQPQQQQPTVGNSSSTAATGGDSSDWSKIPGSVGPPAFARGNHDLFGEPKTEQQMTATERYKAELKLQIDEKKRKEDEEKLKVKAEEERMQRRIVEDQKKMQEEFEIEQQKIKLKEEEARRKNGEMKRLAEEKRVAAEDMRRQAEEKQKEQEEAGVRERAATEQRGLSPPIPTHGNDRASPPVPAIRSKTDTQVELSVDVTDGTQLQARSKSQPAQNITRTPRTPASKPPSRSRRLPKQDSVPSSNQNTPRASSAEVLEQLSIMRRQLHQERARVENALDEKRNEVDVYDPRTDKLNSKPVDVFEVARRKASGRTRQTAPPGAGGVGASTTSLLQADTAFIDVGNSQSAFPDDFDDLRKKDARRRRRQNNVEQQRQDYGDTESVASLDPDRVTQRNQNRLNKLKQIASDDISVADPDDILDRFMTRQTHNRPPSNLTLQDESWMRAGSRQS